MSSSSWLPESATEWIDSASIELDWVSRNATNFVRAMPRLAASAARMARVPPSALTAAHSRSSVRPVAQVGDVRRGEGVDTARQREVQGGEVGGAHKVGEPLQRVAGFRRRLADPDAGLLGGQPDGVR